MNSEFLFKALPIKSELWSFSITVKLCNTHEEFINNIHTFLGGYRFLKCDTHTQTHTHTYLTALQPTYLCPNIQTPDLETQTAPVHNTLQRLDREVLDTKKKKKI